MPAMPKIDPAEFDPRSIDPETKAFHEKIEKQLSTQGFAEAVVRRLQPCSWLAGKLLF